MVKLQPHPRFNRRALPRKKIADRNIADRKGRGRERRSPTRISPKRRRTPSKDRRSQRRRAVAARVIGKNTQRKVVAHNSKTRESPPERRPSRAKMRSSKISQAKTVGGGNPRSPNGSRRALGANHRNARETRGWRERDWKAKLGKPCSSEAGRERRDSRVIGKRDTSTFVKRWKRTFVAAKAMPKAAAKNAQAKIVGGGHPPSPNGARSETETNIRKNPKKPAARPTPFGEHVLDARSIVVSCGINNCVDSKHSNKSCREFSNWQSKTYGTMVKAGHLSDNPAARERFLRSFRKNFPSLCEGRNIQVVDCTVFRNPGHDEIGRRHTGAHPDIMHNVYTNKLFREVHSDLRSMTPTGKNLVIIVCRSGRHRSVASALACSDVIQQRMYNGEQGTVCAVHLQQETHWNRLCHQSCSECNLNNARKQEIMTIARNILKDIVPTNLPLGASPNRAAISPIPAPDSKFGGPKADKIDDHHAHPIKLQCRDDNDKEYPEQSQSSWGKHKWPPDEKNPYIKIKYQPKWNEKEGCREEDWREGKEKGDEESSHLKLKNESWKDDRDKGWQDSSKQRWSKGGERGESERGGDEIYQPLPAGFIPPPPPPSPSVPPTPPSPPSTVRGSVGRVFQTDAAVGKNGVTKLTRVGGSIRQPSSQGSLPQKSLEQSRKHSTRTESETETDVSVWNQMLTDLRINSNIRKIPAGCIQQTSGMSTDSARIVLVDSENDMRGLSQLHHYIYMCPHSARVSRL